MEMSGVLRASPVFLAHPALAKSRYAQYYCQYMYIGGYSASKTWTGTACPLLISYYMVGTTGEMDSLFKQSKIPNMDAWKRIAF